jgi:hypothetical protein
MEDRTLQNHRCEILTTAAVAVVALPVQFQSMRQCHNGFRGMFVGLQTVADDMQ